MSGGSDPRQRPPYARAASSTSTLTGHHVRRRVADQASALATRARRVQTGAVAALNDKASSSTSTDTANVYSTLAYQPRRQERRGLHSTASNAREAVQAAGSRQPRPTPPQDEVYPVLLPGYTFSRPSSDAAGGEPELYITLRGFVARQPATQGRGQRMFNLMARQLARLPKPLSASSTSVLLNTNPSSTDDGHFFPSVPLSPTTDTVEGGDRPPHQPLTERIAEEITDHIDEEVLGKLVEKVGALPIDGHRDDKEARQREGAERQKSRESKASGDDDGRPPLHDLNLQVLPSTRSQTQSAEQSPLASSSKSSFVEATSTPLAPPQSSSASSSSGTSTTTTSRISRLKAKGLAMSRSNSSSEVANSQLVGGSQFWIDRSLDEIHTLTRNLNERLADFWIFRVASVPVRVDIQGKFEDDGGEWTTVLAQQMVTDGNGMFCLKVNLGTPPGETLRGLRARAVMPQQQSDKQDSSTSPPSSWIDLDLPPTSPTSLRLISDVDDTIRKTNVLQGLTSVFRQVFVLAHHEVVVPGMAHWYHSLRASPHAVGIHFVSNAPIELWRPVREFLTHAGMPGGHLHLKSYNSEVEGSTSNTTATSSASAAKTSLLSTWLQPASARKRAAIVSILDDFPQGQFMLVGDTGELDLELYAELAKERPHQVKALYLRNVSSERDPLVELSELNAAAVARLAVGNHGGGGGGEEARKGSSILANTSTKLTAPFRSATSSSVSTNSSSDGTSTPPLSTAAALKRVLPTRSSTMDASATATTTKPRRPSLLTRQSQPATSTSPPPPPATYTAEPSSMLTDSLREASQENLFEAADLQQAASQAQNVAMPSPSSFPSPPAFLARVLKAKNMVPPGTELHFFKEGKDVMAKSHALVERLASNGGGRHQAKP